MKNMISKNKFKFQKTFLFFFMHYVRTVRSRPVEMTIYKKKQVWWTQPNRVGPQSKGISRTYGIAYKDFK